MAGAERPFDIPATREDLVSPTPEDSIDLIMLRRFAWSLDQVPPQYRGNFREHYAKLRETYGEDIFPSGITMISVRPECALVGLKMDAEDFHEGTFVWNGVTFDPFYHKPDSGVEDMLVVNWIRNDQKDSSALVWKVAVANVQSHGSTEADQIYTTKPSGQILLHLPNGVEGFEDSFYFEIRNLGVPISFSWMSE